MKEKKNKKSKIIKGVALLGLFLFVFGVSYALFSVVLNGTKRNRITTGNLKLRLTDAKGNPETEGFGINLENAFPISDEEGLALDGYTFIVENYGDIPVSYTLSLNKEETTTLEDKYIKYNLEQTDYLKRASDYYKAGYHNNKAMTNLSNGTGDEIIGPQKLDTLTDGQLHKTTLLPGEKIEYTLRLWIDFDADNNVMNKEFSTKIRVDGIQATEVSSGPTGDNSKYTLYSDGTLAITGTGSLEAFKMEGENPSYIGEGNPMFHYIAQELGEKYSLNAMISSDNQDIFDIIASGANYLYQSVEYDQLIEGGLNDMDSTFTKEIKNLTRVSRIVVDEGIDKLGNAFFGLAAIGDYMFSLPSTVTQIGENALDYYYGYKIIFPENLKTLGGDGDGTVFYWSVKEFAFNEKIEKINADFEALYQARANAELKIPNTVTFVKGSAFYGWSGNIYIDNSEEFVNTTWNKEWSHAYHGTIHYLK